MVTSCRPHPDQLATHVMIQPVGVVPWPIPRVVVNSDPKISRTAWSVSVDEYETTSPRPV